MPVLDYTIQIIKGNSEYLVYVKMQSIPHSNQSDIDSNSELTARRTQVVARYFEQKGISAKRLILLDPGGAPYAFNEGAAKVQHMKNSEVLHSISPVRQTQALALLKTLESVVQAFVEAKDGTF